MNSRKIFFPFIVLVLIASVRPIHAQNQNFLLQNRQQQYKFLLQNILQEKNAAELDDLRKTPVSLSARLRRDFQYPGDARFALSGVDASAVESIASIFQKVGTTEPPLIGQGHELTSFIDLEVAPYGPGNYTVSVGFFATGDYGLPKLVGYTSLRFSVGWTEKEGVDAGIKLGKSFAFFLGSGWIVYVLAENVDENTTVLVSGPRGWKQHATGVNYNGQSLLFWVPFSEGYPYKDDVEFRFSVTAKDPRTGESVTALDPLIAVTTLWWELIE